jgi:ribonuclease HI
MAEKAIVVYTDGAARGNPGPSASGYAIMSGGKTIRSASVYNGDRTNNYAEYTAIILGLEWCAANLEDPARTALRVVSDSELVVRQLRGTYKVRADGLKQLNSRARGLLCLFKKVEFESVPRENPQISMVDGELNRLLDRIRRA